MTFLRYAVADAVRSWRRTFASILGVLLALVFISGTLIAIDSSTRATLLAMLDDLPGDFTATGEVDNVTQVTERIRGVSGVTSTAPVSIIFIEEIGVWGTPLQTHGDGLAIDPSNPPRVFEDATLEGEMSLGRGEVVLSRGLAQNLNVGLGDRVYLASTFYNETTEELDKRYLNLTVEGLLSISEEYVQAAGWGVYFPTAYVINIADMGWVREQLEIQWTFPTNFEVWIDRDRFVDIYDLDATRRNLARLERDLQAAVLPDRLWIYSNISSVIGNFEATSVFLRVQYIMLSMPVILLGLYLGAIGVDLGHAERRREMAILKTRGAGTRQVVGLLLLEAVIGGAIAAVVGLVAGVALSRLLLGVVNPFAVEVAPQYEEIALSVGTIITVVVLSIIFMLAVTYRSARRTAGLPLVETLRYYVPGETKIDYKPALDVVLLTLGLITYGVVLYSRLVPSNFFIFIFGIIFFFFLPVAPILIIIGATRLLTRSSGRVYEWAARVCKPFARNLYYVISRNLSRNPRRSSNIALIIALGLTFGIFILAVFGSQIAFQQRQIRNMVGADATVTASPEDVTFGSNLTQIAGVAGVTRTSSLWLDPVYCCAEVHAIEPDSFFTVTQPEAWYFDGISQDEAKEILGTPGMVLVSKGYFQRAFLEVGDSLVIGTTMYNETSGSYEDVRVTFIVGGVVRGLPGLDRWAYTVPDSIYGSYASFDAFISIDDGQRDRFYAENRYFIDLEGDADWDGVKAAIVGLGGRDIQGYEEAVEESMASPGAAGILSFVGMEIAFVVIILTAGLGLILYAATLERDVEFAAISARGSRASQTAGLLVGEAVSIVIIGLAIGLGVGILAGYIGTQVFLIGPVSTLELFIPFPFVLPLETYWLIILTPGAMLLTAFLVAWRLSRMNLGKVLKMRGG